MISLWNLFGKLMFPTRTDVEVTASPLHRLPPEIIVLIANVLPKPSAACLALCSRRLSHILGSGYRRSFQSEGTYALLAFLTSLAKDLPQHFACQQCGPVHTNVVSDLVRSALDQLEAKEECRTQTLCCPYCCMDYMLDAIDFGERGSAVLVTRWVDLGAGLDPSDAKWQNHINGSIARLHARHESPHVIHRHIYQNEGRKVGGLLGLG
ncbi:hypothetical protein LAWI1_G003880 [Lachnellula willkommii]|uniref:F-box domain-containing protein n=1 Tax=Lachnellula willkommii TaxID=215461 RepID=A0A559MFN6_9HELO|nr:hypothetical protein LAWI1_G003880 [Lachnellula willkommii]